MLNNKFKFAFLVSLIFLSFINALEQRNLSISLDFSHEDADKDTSLSGVVLYNLIKSQSTLILINEVCWNSFKLFINKNHIEETEAISKNINIYKRNDYLLIIPNNYKNQFPNLGINLDNFQLVKDDCKFKQSIFQKMNLFGDYYSTFPYLFLKSNQFVQVLTKLFISKKKMNNIQWDIFFIGHGSSKSICGVIESEFKKMLNLFENHINTHAFFFESCYGSGKLDINNKKKRIKYSYPIFCKGITDIPTLFFHDFNFKLFFEQLNKIKKDDPNSYNEFLKSTFVQNAAHPLNIISVKYPNEDFFTIPNISNLIFVISDKTSKEEMKQTLMCKNIVINSSIIKEEIKIRNLWLTNIKFITAYNGEHVHYIEKINALDISYPDLFKTFLNPCVKFFASSKIILIKEINCAGCSENKNKNDRLVLFKKADSKKITLKNVIIFINSSTPWSSQRDHEIYFMIDKVPDFGFCANLVGYSEKNINEFYNIEGYELTKQRIKDYLNFFEITKTNLEKGIHKIKDDFDWKFYLGYGLVIFCINIIPFLIS